MSAMEEDDEVLRELDIYVTDELQLYLAQYPLRPVYAEPLNVSSAKMKPNSNKIELAVPFPPNLQKSFDVPPSEQFQRFQSSEIKPANPLGAAFIYEDKFIISPISSVLQFRPSMKQSFGGATTKAETIEMAPEVDVDNLEIDQSDTIQQIQLKRKESERAKAARLQSFSYLKAQEEREPWQPMQVHAIGSRASEQKFESMIEATLSDNV